MVWRQRIGVGEGRRGKARVRGRRIDLSENRPESWIRQRPHKVWTIQSLWNVGKVLGLRPYWTRHMHLCARRLRQRRFRHWHHGNGSRAGDIHIRCRGSCGGWLCPRLHGFLFRRLLSTTQCGLDECSGVFAGHFEPIKGRGSRITYVTNRDSCFVLIVAHDVVFFAAHVFFVCDLLLF